ncbi:unnamed protein product, partial [Symbiodinium necroappetens]
MPLTGEANTAHQRKYMRKGRVKTYEKKWWKNSKVTAVVLPKLKMKQRNIAAIGDLELNFRPGGTDLNIL